MNIDNLINSFESESVTEVVYHQEDNDLDMRLLVNLDTTVKSCQNIECNKEFEGTERAKFCCNNCRLKQWRNNQSQGRRNQENRI